MGSASWYNRASSAPTARRVLITGVALSAMKGWYVPEMESAYRRARELCESLDDDLKLFSVLSGLWSFHLVRGEHTMACSFADEMVRLAPRLQHDGALVQSDWASGCSRFFKGQFAEAQACEPRAGYRAIRSA